MFAAAGCSFCDTPPHLIPPDRTTVAGVRAYASVADIPDPVDLAVFCVPGASVLDEAEAAMRKGTRRDITRGLALASRIAVVVTQLWTPRAGTLTRTNSNFGLPAIASLSGDDLRPSRSRIRNLKSHTATKL